MATLILSKNKYYALVRFYENSKRIGKLVPLHTAQKAKANRLLIKINEREKLFRNGYIPLSEVTLKFVPPIENLIDEFLDYLSLKGDSAKTLDVYKLSLKDFRNFVGDRDITLLNKSDFVPFMEMLKSLYSHPVTLNIRLKCIRAFFSWLLENEKIDKIPFKISIIRVDKKKPKYFTNDEIESILRRIDSTGNKELAARVRLHLNTGMRLRELKNSYLENGFIHVFKSKGRKERTIPVDSETAFYFGYCKSNGKLRSNSISRLFHHVLKELGYDKTPSGDRRCFHCLRHTFAIRKYIETGNIYHVCKLLGHFSVTMTEIYAEFDIEQIARDFGQSGLFHNSNFLAQKDPNISAHPMRFL